MAKRFIDGELFKKKWFRSLNGDYKAFFIYLFTNCDCAGVWEVDFELASLFCGNINQETAEVLLADHIIKVDNDKKWFLKDFVQFQYGEKLNEKSPVHKKVMDILVRYKVGNDSLLDIVVDTLFKKNNRLSYSLQDKEEEEDKVKEEVKAKEEEKPREKILMPFSEKFTPTWQAWKDYKRSQFQFIYKTILVEQAAMTELVAKSMGDERTAIAIVNQSIANGWKGFFELKNKTNTNGHSQFQRSARKTNEQATRELLAGGEEMPDFLKGQ